MLEWFGKNVAASTFDAKIWLIVTSSAWSQSSSRLAIATKKEWYLRYPDFDSNTSWNYDRRYLCHNGVKFRGTDIGQLKPQEKFTGSHWYCRGDFLLRLGSSR